MSSGVLVPGLICASSELEDTAQTWTAPSKQIADVTNKAVDRSLSGMRNDNNISAENENCTDIDVLIVGDQIELVFEDEPEIVIRATVSKLLSDRDEGMGPEVEDYIACFCEIEMEQTEADAAQEVSRTDAWKRTLALGTDRKCSLDGRPVRLRKR